MNKEANIKHSELVQSLAKHFQQMQATMVFTQVGLGSRWLQRGVIPSPDVLTMRKSYTKPAVSIYECKATKDDFRHEITSGKWAKYRPYCNRLYFATPAGLITKADIPSGCGWIVHGPKGWSVVVAPEYNPDLELGEWEYMSLLFSLRTEQSHIRKLEDRRRALANLDHHNPTLSHELARALGDASRACQLSRQEHRLCGDLINIVAKQLGLNPEELRHSPYLIQRQVADACNPIGAELRGIAQSLLRIAERGGG